MKKQMLVAAAGLWVMQSATSALVTNPDDPRSWQGATVGTFAQLYYGSNTLANRQLVVTNQLLDDGIFNTASYVGATMIQAIGVQSTGTSLDTTGTGSFAYVARCSGCSGALDAGKGIDAHWIQTDNVIGH